MNEYTEQHSENNNRSNGNFLSILLIGLSVALTLGFSMVDQIGQRARMQAGINQQDPALAQAAQVQRQIEKLLTDFAREAPEQAQELFKQFNISLRQP